MKERILIYDKEVAGHHVEYLIHLFKYISSQQIQKNRYLFLLNHKVEKILNNKLFKGIHVIYIPEEENEKFISEPNLIKRSIKEWRYLMNLIQQQGNIKKLFFLKIDLYQYVIGKNNDIDVKIGGILFSNYSHL